MRAATPADYGRDLLDVLGRQPGEEVRLDRNGLTIGEQTVSLAELRGVAMGLRTVWCPDIPARKIVIADLEG